MPQVKNILSIILTATTIVALCLVSLILFSFTSQKAYGETLPSMTLSDDFGGQSVNNLSTFVPTTGNYTLEMKANAGETIGINFANVHYTMTEGGTVRFVQYESVIYVFENDKYVTKLTPNPQYTLSSENKTINGSFEEVTQEFTTGRWQAATWQTWDGGMSVWGSDAGKVSVREDSRYCSDGTKSIIMHYEVRYLYEDIATTIEAGKTYLLSYDYWTSNGSGNGDATYTIMLGTSTNFPQYGSWQGHTTPTAADEGGHYEVIIQTPETLGDEVLLNLYRPISKCDWLDNICLYELTPTAQGITGGVSDVLYYNVACAPKNIILENGDCVEMTSYITNASFDDATLSNSAPAGWTLETPSGVTSKISTAAKGNGIIAADQNHWQLWSSSGGLVAKAYQTLTDLPNGKYEVGATVCNVSSNTNVYANSGTKAVTGNGTFKATGIVYDGTLELGLDINITSGSVTVDFDDFTLKYYGIDAESYAEVLKEKIKTAQAIVDGAASIDNDNVQAAIKALESTIQSVQGVDNNDINALETALQQLDNAISKYEAALATYNDYLDLVEELNNNISEAEAYLAANDYPDKTALQTIIDTAKQYVSSKDNDVLKEQAFNVRKGISDYYASQYTEEPVNQTISYVDTSLSGSEKYTLRVDGKPIYLTDIQMRWDKLYGYNGWTDDEMEVLAKQAAADGFNTLSVPVFWAEVEPEKNRFDWQILDKYMGWCNKYGMHMELLWFSWSSGGRVQYLWDYNGKQTLRTPDYVCSMEGTSEFNMLRTSWEYSLDWRDTNLRDRETYILGEVMEHIARWEAHNGQPHTVIGVQLGNEARGHGDNTATAAEIIAYYSAVGTAVKNSKHKVWTRLNCVSYETSGRISANESKRNNGGTNIDFVGVDIYGADAGMIKDNMWGYLPENGKNFRMIMEIDAKDSNSPIYQMAALAGNKAFDYYNYAVVDGNCLYANSGHTIVERSHVTLVRQRNKILNLANQDLAIKKQGIGLYVYNYAGNSTSSESGLHSISFTPASATTQAVAIHHNDNEYLLMTTAAGTFTIPDNIEVGRVTYGYTDSDNNWVEESEYSGSLSSITLTEASCVRLEIGEVSDDGGDDTNPDDPNSYMVNGEFDNSTMDGGGGAPHGWNQTFSVTTSKISVVAKGDGSVIVGNQNHWQVWNGSGVSGQMYQTITGLPAGRYTLTIGSYSTFGGTVTLFAGDQKTEIKSGENAYYTVDFESDGTNPVTIGLILATSGVTDIEFDHVTLSLSTNTDPLEKSITVFTCGDSTMANKSSQTERGWGMLFPNFVNASKVTVSNNGFDGYSTKSYIDGGKWTNVINNVSSGDYVLIQFGHNDEKTTSSLHTDPQTTFKENLTKFITETRAKDANPVLITPIVRRTFGSDGNIINDHEEYTEAMQELAAELDVPLIDMSLLSGQYENIAGIEGARALHEYFPGSEIDNTHLCQFGAYITARCIAEQIALDDNINIPTVKSTLVVDGTYSSTVEYAQNALAALYSDIDVSQLTTLDELDAAVRQRRYDDRQALVETSKPADATFALVNADLAEGTCWNNEVQGALPMGWMRETNVSGSTDYSLKTADGYTYYGTWAAKIGYIDVNQTVTNLPSGTYKVDILLKASTNSSPLVSGTTGTAYVYAKSAGNTSKSTTAQTPDSWETLSTTVKVTDGTLKFGLRSENGWYARLSSATFSILEADEETGIRFVSTDENANAGTCYYSVNGTRLAEPQKGVNIVRYSNGAVKKVLIK